ncbi:FAD-binding oxidoreductase [Nocardiopsis sp. CNT-189]|uniref:FAD-binding oxidoreductase n=1 Tax=Nocardiopsis oceanisediminis TaxID=2816862 RepID=UPI003B306062
MPMAPAGEPAAEAAPATAGDAAAELGAGGCEVRAGTGRDAVGGTVPRWVVAPPDAGACAAAVAAAARLGLAVVPRGAGTKIDWGAPPDRCDVLLDTSALDAVEHAAGDLIATAGAGTPLAQLASELAGAGQRLPVEEVVPGSTVGGAVAAGLSGPGRLLHGRLRDLIIGMEFVRADGTAARSGGRVVKNVAGYDLAKLHTGALGTLGVVTSVTFRLRPLPAAVRVVSATAADPAGLRARAAAVAASPVVPAAVELDAPVGGPLRLHVLLEGPAEGIDARAERTADLLGADNTGDAVPPGWGALPGSPGDTLLKAVLPPARLAEALEALAAGAREAGLPVPVRGSAGSGALFAAVPAGADPAAAAALIGSVRAALVRASGGHGSLTVPHAAPALRRHGVDLWGEVPGLPLMRAVKDAFDPHRLLSPGRFAGGI